MASSGSEAPMIPNSQNPGAATQDAAASEARLNPSAPQTTTLDGFTLGRTLGSGFSAKVKLAKSQDGTEYALKIFRLDNPEFDERAFRLLKAEIEAAEQLTHRNVVKYHAF